MLTDLTNIPVDLSQETSLNGKYLKGIPTSVTDPDVYIGNVNHTHTPDGDHVHAASVPSHTHSATHSSPVSQRNTVQNTGGASNINHTHSLTSSSVSLASITTDGDHTHDAKSNDLEHRTITFYKKTNTSIGMSRKALPRNMTFFYSKTGSIPAGTADR